MNIKSYFLKKVMLVISFLLPIIMSLILPHCSGQKKRTCITNEKDHHLYLKIDKLKKMDKLIPNINVMVDYENTFDGAQYYRVNNNYWYGDVPSLDKYPLAFSLWIPKDSCIFYQDEPNGREYIVYSFSFEDILTSNDKQLYTYAKLYLLPNKKVLLIAESGSTASLITESGDSLKDYLHWYGDITEESANKMHFVMSSKNNYLFMENPSGFIIPQFGRPKENLEFECKLRENDTLECKFPKRKKSILYGKKSKETFIGF